MVTPDVDLATLIAAQVGSLTYGTNLFDGPVRPPDQHVPVNAVFVLVSGGDEPQAFLGETECWNVHSVTIFVRGSVDGFDACRTLAKSVRSAVHFATISGYFDIRARDSFLEYAGQDSEGRHIYIINVDMIIKE